MIKLGSDESLPNGWQWVEAYSVMDVRDGTHDSPKSVENGIPLVTSKNLIGGKIDFSTCNMISEDDHVAISKRSAVDDGDILYAMIGTIGNPVIVEKQFEFSIKNVALFKFTKSSQVYNRYIYHFLNSDLATRQFESNSRGGTQKFVSLGNIRGLQIPLPPIAEQKRIAAILDKADAIRRKRQQAIQLADDFLRSVFLDMFGDPVTNPKGWEVKALKDIAKIQIGPFGTQLHKEDYIENGVPLINPTHIVKGNIVPKSNLTISYEKHAYLPEYHLEIGDIIMGRRGEMGRCAIVSEKEEGWMCGTGSLFIRPNKAGVFSEYLNKLLSSQTIKKHLQSESQGATMPNLNKKIVGDIKIPVPSNEALDQFTSLKSKLLTLTGSSHDFANAMIFESICQKAFAGEL
ncbi:restriction endonuclease subunit S [Shewanella phaeophyticola]|uniref:Restriction endonuclease subunit S n=1 Tax=Shewanella phaeophyticola TaxID=2978345 RepID=A0ABT2P1T7_9GAMM|nr:restriction endonuclease subunit S [Shewanella sp. KJ10-1]MCT8986598.1 restriction endonuclease subunit S [Shewanella sp. KJ10-1]